MEAISVASKGVLNAQLSSGGVKISIPPGRYVISSTITIPQYVTICGAGYTQTTILAKTTDPIFNIAGQNGFSAQFIDIRDIVFDAYSDTYKNNYTAIAVSTVFIRSKIQVLIWNALYGITTVGTSGMLYGCALWIDTHYTKFAYTLLNDSNGNTIKFNHLRGTTSYNTPAADGSIGINIKGDSNTIEAPGSLDCFNYAFRLIGNGVLDRIYVEHVYQNFHPDSEGYFDSFAKINAIYTNEYYNGFGTSKLILNTPSGLNKTSWNSFNNDSGSGLGNGLVAGYYFGQIAPNGKITDVTGNGKHIDLSNVSQTLVDGIYGKALRAVSNAGTFGSIPSSIISTSKPFTFFVNLRATTLPIENIPFAWYVRFNNPSTAYIGLRLTGGAIVQMYDGTTVTTPDFTQVMIKNANVSYCVTVDVPNNKIIVYDPINYEKKETTVNFAGFSGISSIRFNYAAALANTPIDYNSLLVFDRELSQVEYITLCRMSNPILSQQRIETLARMRLGDTSAIPEYTGQTAIVNSKAFISLGTSSTSDWRSILTPEDYVHGSISGTRPTLLPGDAGYQLFDTSLGKPIWWNGTAWVDSSGVTV